MLMLFRLPAVQQWLKTVALSVAMLGIALAALAALGALGAVLPILIN